MQGPNECGRSAEWVAEPGPSPQVLSGAHEEDRGKDVNLLAHGPEVMLAEPIP